MQRPAKPFTPVRFRLQPPYIMKVGIIGFGFVGKALFEGLLDNVEVCKIDPILNTTLDDLNRFNPQVTFICLPTPMNKDGSQDISVFVQTLKDIKSRKIKGLVVVKSTVHPGNINKIKEIFPDFVYNPEFLREKHAIDDFINSSLIVFGGLKESSNLLANFYDKYTKCINKDYVFTDHIAASLIKYTINSFLATKVVFFNELHNLFNKTNTEETWENFISFLQKDKRIGNSHMMVPGHDKRLGFGGACLPKDTNAILKYSQFLESELNLVKEAIKINNKVRASYNTLTDREVEQNIIFNKNEEE